MLTLFPQNTKLEILHGSTREPTGLVLELINIDHDDIHTAKLDALKSLRARGLTETTDILADLPTKISVVAACVIGWEVKSDDWRQAFKTIFNFEDESFSKEKALALLSHPNSAWIRSQIDVALNDKDRFFPQASTE